MDSKKLRQWISQPEQCPADQDRWQNHIATDRGSAGGRADADRFATEVDGFIRSTTVIKGGYGGSPKFLLPGLCDRVSAPPGKNHLGSSHDRPGGHHGSGRI